MHVFDAAEEPFEPVHLVLQHRDFFLRKPLEIALKLHVLQLAQTRDPFLNRREVRERAAQPALVDEERSRALGLLAHDVLCLLLGTDEQDHAAGPGQLLDRFVGFAEFLNREREIDNVDAVALLEDERLHLGVPTARLVTEVDAGLQ